ncbi:uncharacterized protein BHQ10_005160 [Talaromyces amestolkiae]|uniref:Ecp2 effector protein domain-containing protein n=1 Tax=Talaromyces amestolkiae TaxID=1196081 RepID=A0A364L031_TALAM|nr:uncharacterized protein BHQ10_005160 [Talaromyces amestolkiae]RAO69148.1 hypothetical protein BHQ10_005160 [Talaromyces amestolkiae]
MKFSLLAIPALIACATAYNLTVYTDDSCSEGAADFSGPDFQGDQGTVGHCVQIGFQAKSIWFVSDTDTEQQFSAWNTPEEPCVASEKGQNEADVTLYTGQPSGSECQSTVDGAYSTPDGVAQFLVGVVG